MLAFGCSTTRQTENMLSEAGFRRMPATTPAQKAHLQTLPRQKVTMVVREGKTYFVYPDEKRQVLYVGTRAQYDAYQRLRLEHQMAEEQARAAHENAAAAWAPWGPWGGVNFVEPVPAFRR
jgi:hypothetical protein